MVSIVLGMRIASNKPISSARSINKLFIDKFDYVKLLGLEISLDRRFIFVFGFCCRRLTLKMKMTMKKVGIEVSGLIN